MSSMAERVKTGTPMDALLIDEHCHIGYFPGLFAGDCSAEGVIQMMDSLGIDRAVVTHSAALQGDYRWGNDRIIEAIQTYPDRFYGYCTINPHYPESMRDELNRCFEHDGMRGIKLHPYTHQRALSYKHYVPVYEFAAQRRLFVMSHTYTPEDVMATDVLAREYSDAIFIMAHTGGEGHNVEQALEVAGKHDNVYGDVAVSQSFEGNIEWFVREIGSRKVLFGTDMACMTPVATVARIAMAEISDEEKLDIFGLNMQRILDYKKR
ncbi:MAG: amidohydrolase family protein [Oscillospiraceae bacterium]|nr:amidohydrolase family protein [Oscillospiraceae bacterium]